MTQAPLEIELAQRLEMFGADALGIAPLSVALSRRIVLSRNVLQAYHNRRAFRVRDENGTLIEGENWTAWATQYPEQSELLAWAEQLAGEE